VCHISLELFNTVLCGSPSAISQLINRPVQKRTKFLSRFAVFLLLLYIFTFFPIFDICRSRQIIVSSGFFHLSKENIFFSYLLALSSVGNIENSVALVVTSKIKAKQNRFALKNYFKFVYKNIFKCSIK
jgi:hypothetical protein